MLSQHYIVINSRSYSVVSDQQEPMIKHECCQKMIPPSNLISYPQF